MTSFFAYNNGALCAEQVPLARIADGVGTPCYVYSAAQLRANYRAFTEPFAGLSAKFFYAVKAAPNIAIIRLLASMGAGADVTSSGELERALAGGVAPANIAFSGVGKTRDDIALALKHGIYQFNVESLPELRLIDEVAAAVGATPALTLRVNPDVAARTHKKTSTGELGTKFGIDYAQLDEAAVLIRSLKHIAFKGFHVHIGSHVYDYEPFRDAFQKIAELVAEWRGKGFAIDRVDLGGGVGIPYDGQSLAPFADYAAIVRETLGGIGCELGFEPGRRIVGDAAVLLARVTYDKAGANRRFLIVDAGMNDLLRPAMYEARHSIWPVRESRDTHAPLADVVGPVCETSDLFGVDYRLPGVGQGDLVAIMQAGAYGAAMASTYNGRPLVPEVMVDGEKVTTIRRRISVAEQMGWES